MSQPPSILPPSSDNNRNDNKLTDFDWSSVFPPGRIKTQIQLEDDNIGCLPKKTLELISTCSTLLLRKIVQTSCTSKEKGGKTGRTAKASAASPPSSQLLAAQDIQKGIQEGPESLHFLQDVVDQAVRDDDGKVASRKTRKRKATKSVKDTIADSSKPLAKLRKSHSTTAGISKETLEQAVELSKEPTTQNTKGGVVLDEEDYD